MPMFTKKQPEADVAVAEAPGVTVEQAQAALTAATMELARLRALLATGEEVSASMEAVERTILTRAGRQQVTADEPAIHRRQISALERLRAGRQLRAVEEQVLAAQERVEEAKLAAVSTDRAHQEAALAAGLKVVRAELPGVLRALKDAQRAMQAYAVKVTECDAALGRRHFAESTWPYMMADTGGRSAVDFFESYVTAMFDLEGR